MASVINTNMASLVAQKNLTNSQANLTTSVERLSSGMRINRAKDDAAGLGISQVLQQQIKGLDMSVRNAGDAISIAQTAEGAINEVSEILQRMKELSVQGQNDSLNDAQNLSIGQEVTALQDEITAIVARTNFNGIALIGGAGGTLSFQTGADSTDTTDMAMSEIDMTTATLAIDTDVSAATADTDWAAYEELVDTAIETTASARGTMGAYQNRLNSAIGNMQAMSENLSSAKSRITDTDYAKETAQLTKTQIQQQAATAMLAQANQMPNVVLSLLK